MEKLNELIKSIRLKFSNADQDSDEDQKCQFKNKKRDLLLGPRKPDAVTQSKL